MLCEHCGLNEAQTHYTVVINGKSKAHHYCADCAAKLLGGAMAAPITGAFPDPFVNLLSNLLGAKSEAAGESCPVCRKGLREISASGRMGCPDCYSHFERELSPYISRLHGTSAHAGKTPRGGSPKRAVAREVARLKNELALAVETQEYERAAGLRDEINRLEGGGLSDEEMV